MKVGIDAFTTNQAFSRVIELTADNFLLPYSCQAFGTLVPRAWHSSANSLTQLCQRLGTSKATVFFHIPVYTLSAQIGERADVRLCTDYSACYDGQRLDSIDWWFR